jgi:hypothetical protein
MIRGLKIRIACFLIAWCALVSLPHILHYSDELQVGLLLLYLVVGGSILARYLVKHEDEIPTRGR